MWLYRFSIDGKSPIILYDYQPSRVGQNAANYLKEFKGYLHTDGYSGYGKVKNVIPCGCWAHVRRYFVEAMPDKKSKDPPTIAAEVGRDYCNRLFEILNTTIRMMNKSFGRSMPFYGVIKSLKATPFFNCANNETLILLIMSSLIVPKNKGR